MYAFPSGHNPKTGTQESGMTLRDFFAAAVLQGMYANPHHRYNTHYADSFEAYAMADVMIKEKNNERG
jgi:hypothetical protein